MWNAIYSNIDKNGFNPELKVTVSFSNDSDDRTYEKVYEVLPQDLDSDVFKKIIQSQIDIFNSKSNVQETTLDSLMDTQISPKQLK